MFVENALWDGAATFPTPFGCVPFRKTNVYENRKIALFVYRDQVYLTGVDLPLSGASQLKEGKRLLYLVTLLLPVIRILSIGYSLHTLMSVLDHHFWSL